MRNIKVQAFLLMLLCIFTSVAARADAWGNAWIDYDPVSKVVYATCGTDSGWNEYYIPQVGCYIYKNGILVASWGAVGYFGSGPSVSADVEADASAASPGDVYEVQARNTVESTFFNGLYFYDPWDYTYWTYLSVYEPDWFDYYSGPLGEQLGPNVQLELGTVYQQTVIPGVVEVSSVTISQPPSISGSQCATGTVQVHVSRPRIGDNPTVQVEMSVFSSNPSGTTATFSYLTPETGQQQITGDTGSYTFRVCRGNQSGKVTLTGNITFYSPTTDFTRKDYAGFKPELTIN